MMRRRTHEQIVAKVRNFEYHRGYKSGYTDGLKAGYSAEWHDGYNEGARTQNAIDIMHRTVRTHRGVTSIGGLVDTLRVQDKLVEAKNAQIELLSNRVASLRSIIRTLEESDDDE